jgi:hypothetical protein
LVSFGGFFIKFQDQLNGVQNNSNNKSGEKPFSS